MILETEEEENAFNFICKLASESTDAKGCNDLEEEDFNNFKHLSISSNNEDGSPFLRKAVFDFDIINWLHRQIKIVEKVN